MPSVPAPYVPCTLTHGVGSVRTSPTAGLVSETAGALLSSPPFSKARPAAAQGGVAATRITISWFQLSAQQPEVIVDMLNAAASLAPRGNVSAQGLSFREAGDGSTLDVPGLLKVEVRSAEDAQDIITRVRENSRRLQIGPATSSHSVVTLHLHGLPRAGGNGRGPLRGVKAAGQVTRLSFIMFGDMFYEENPPAPGGGDHPVSIPRVMAWMPPVSEVVSALEQGHPAPPYHRARLALLLRSSLCGSIESSWVCAVDPALERTGASLDLLRLASRIKGVCSGPTPKPRAPNRAPPDPPASLQLVEPGPGGGEGEVEGRVDADAADVLGEVPESPSSPGEKAAAASPTDMTATEQIIHLSSQLKAVCDMCESLRVERDSLRRMLEDDREHLRAKARERLRRAEQDIEDWKMYKAVMDEGIERMQEEAAALRKERDDFKRRLERKDAALKKGKRSNHGHLKEVVELRQKAELSQQMQATAEAEAEQLREQLEESRIENQVSAAALAQSKAEASRLQAGAEAAAAAAAAAAEEAPSTRPRTRAKPAARHALNPREHENSDHAKPPGPREQAAEQQVQRLERELSGLRAQLTMAEVENHRLLAREGAASLIRAPASPGGSVVTGTSDSGFADRGASLRQQAGLSGAEEKLAILQRVMRTRGRGGGQAQAPPPPPPLH